MQEKSLLRVSLAISFAGLLAMAWLAANPDFDAAPTGSLSPEDVGRGVKVCGNVEGKFTSRNGHTFFTLTDGTGSVKVVVFNSTRAVVGGGSVCVTGRVDLYEGDLEVVAKGVEDA